MEEITKHQIVYFSTSTCGPCKISKPFVEKISTEKEIDTLFYIVDQEENGRDTAVHFNVRAVPTIIFFKDGVETFRKVGMVKEDEFLNMCTENIEPISTEF